MGNIAWYSERFGDYHEAVQRRIARSRYNLAPEFIPDAFRSGFAFFDGSGLEVARVLGQDNAQSPFWNGYMHGHFIFWQGISFPDGMVVIDGPFPGKLTYKSVDYQLIVLNICFIVIYIYTGYYTDIMAWRDSEMQVALEEVMVERAAAGQDRHQLYADKIYYNSILVRRAYSRGNCPLQQYMLESNSIMSEIRVAVE